MPARQRLQQLAALRAGALRVALVLSTLVAASVARAQPAADEAFAAGRLDEAAARYGRALESGGLEPDQLAHVHLRLAELAALASLDDEATRHLGAAIAIRPQGALSESAPPALAEEADALRGERVRVQLIVSGPDDPVEIAVRDAPEALVRTLAIRGSGGYARSLPWEGEARSLEVPASARPLEVRALDRHGNTVALAGALEPEIEPEPAEEEPLPIPDPEDDDGDAPDRVPAGDDPEEGPSLVENPWLWVAVGLVVLGVGVAVGVSASGERFVVGAPEVR